MEGITIAEMARQSGLTVHTLRYYERIGLMSAIPRAESGHRRYRAADVGWVDFLHKLRSTGMPIREMVVYAELMRAGPSTCEARQRILEHHRDRVAAEIAARAAHLEAIEFKIERYKKGEFR